MYSNQDESSSVLAIIIREIYHNTVCIKLKIISENKLLKMIDHNLTINNSHMCPVR